jgi:hypothetical protein
MILTIGHDRNIDQPASVIAWSRVGLRAGYEITMLASGEAMEPRSPLV